MHGPRDRPQVALTFHSQGPLSIAEALLAEAERASARLSVLAVGTWLEQYPQIAQRILGGGHDLGNHTMHHGDSKAVRVTGRSPRSDRPLRIAGKAVTVPEWPKCMLTIDPGRTEPRACRSISGVAYCVCEGRNQRPGQAVPGPPPAALGTVTDRPVPNT